MSVLLMRLAGPMQSWGTRSRFTHRDTDLEPSKSGVIGILCAALGWQRDSETFEIAGLSYTLEEFARNLLMAVRVDREGRLMRDYHTAQNVRRADPTKGTQETVLSERFYLADADFLVGLEGERALLQRLDVALRQPVWPLFLGRKSFVPSLPVAEGVCDDGNRLEVLSSRPWRRRHRGERSPDKPLRGILEVSYGTGEPRQDVPLSFVSRDRQFAVRHVCLDPTLFPIPLILEPDEESPDVPQQAGPQPRQPEDSA
jgi:CRISPR system Cascade subunit CasD